MKRARWKKEDLWASMGFCRRVTMESMVGRARRAKPDDGGISLKRRRRLSKRKYPYGLRNYTIRSVATSPRCSVLSVHTTLWKRDRLI